MLIGIDIGGTKCAVTLGDRQGNVLQKRRFATTEVYETLENILSSAKELAEGKSIAAAGISCGGPLDEEKGLILSPPNLPDWDKVPIVKLVSDALGVPAFLQNDANACALAEYRWGAGKGCKHMAFLTFGTGLGAGIIVDGKLLRGATGNAGEIGHVRLTPDGPVGYGKAGSMEGWCSGGGLAQQGGKPAVELAQDAARGDQKALAVFEQCGEMLGRGLAILVDILGCERIVIGSIYARCEHLLKESMWKTLRQEALPQAAAACEIVPSGLGEGLGDAAALITALEGLK